VCFIIIFLIFSFSALFGEEVRGGVVSGQTADGMPVVDPLVAGALYQIFYQVDRLLTREGIIYWIDAGTCLGAERHQGLIPWDGDVDIAIAPGEERKLHTAKLRRALARVGLRMEPHLLGYKVFARQDHPLGCQYRSIRWYQKSPGLDIFTTREELRAGELVYSYKTEYSRAHWPDVYYRRSEVFNSEGKQRRVAFGPLTVNGLWNATAVCHRLFGDSCFTEGYQQYDHINEQPIESIPVKLTDFRPPAYQEWEGLPHLLSNNY
jgi:hypothetical protein